MPAPNEIGHTRFLREDGTWVEVEATGGGGIATEDVVIDNSLTIVGGEPNYISIRTINGETFELKDVDIMPHLNWDVGATINCVEDKNIIIGLNDARGYENSCIVELAEVRGSNTYIDKMDTERYYTAVLNITCEDAQSILIYPIEDTKEAGDYLTRNVILYGEEPFSTRVDRINSLIIHQRTEVIAIENRNPPMTVKNTYSNENIHVLDWNGNVTYAGDVTATDENGIRYSLINVAKNGGSGGGGSVPTNNPIFTGSVSLGRKADSTIGNSSAVFGSENVASGSNSFATGVGALATGNGAHAEGHNTEASNQDAHAEGYTSIASGYASHAEGIYFGTLDADDMQRTIASGSGAHAEGVGTQAKEGGSHSEGVKTVAEGEASHAEGSNTQALAKYSHTEGVLTTVNTSAKGGHAEGRETVAGDEAAHAEGYGSQALGYISHAEGWNTVAEAQGSHAEGLKTIAKGKYQHVQGKYNVEDTVDTSGYGKYSHIVGGGSGTARKNIHTLDWDGNAWYEGQVHARQGLAVGTVKAASGSVAVGDRTSATGAHSIAIGENANAEDYYSFAQGYNVYAKGICSFVSGEESRALGNYSFTEGIGHKETYSPVHIITEPFTVTSFTQVQSDSTSNIPRVIINANDVKAVAYVFLQPYLKDFGDDDNFIPGIILLHDNERVEDIEIIGKFYLNCGYTMFHFTTYNLPSTVDINRPSQYTVKRIEVDIAKGFAATHVQGKYSKLLPNYAHIVGGGTSNTDRKNIYTLDWDGNATFGNDIVLAGLQLNQWVAVPSNLSTINFTDFIREIQEGGTLNTFVPAEDMRNVVALPVLLERYNYSFSITASSELAGVLGGEVAMSLRKNYFVGTLRMRKMDQTALELQNTLITYDETLNKLVIWTTESVNKADVYTMTFNTSYMASNAKAGISLLETINSLQERIAALEAQLT